MTVLRCQRDGPGGNVRPATQRPGYPEPVEDTMKVVFFEDVEGTAQVGEVKDVKNGFARNFLLPRGAAGPVNKDNVMRANSLAQKEARRQEKLDGDARKITDKITNYTVTLEARVGESGRLFGSITNRDIAEKLNAATNLAIDPHIILLPEPIRDIGPRPVTIKFTRNVSVEITVDVQPDEASKPIVEKMLAERAAEAAAEAKRKAEAEYAARQAGIATAEDQDDSEEEESE
ncbi:MAG: 50S ribosomal protein L9 [Anaerolinea sp.]|nr:50S ribosomal protein L9 [Anaerolinea sp.]